MGMALLRRLTRALRSRLFRSSTFLIFAAPATVAIGSRACLTRSVLLRISDGVASNLGHVALAEDAMCTAREPAGLVKQRLAHGDEFFGWMMDGRVVSFGWVTYTERAIGCHRLKGSAGRVFLYNFHTIAAFRGNGLCGALLLAIRHVLGSEGATEFIIDAERRNGASINAIGKAGFATIAHAGFGTLLGYWRWPHWRSVVAGMHQDLFSE